MNLPPKPLTLGFAGGALGAVAVLAVAFVVVPALTAPAPAQQAPCDPHALAPDPDPYAPDPYALDPFRPAPIEQPDMFDHNNTALVVYEFNTGRISSASVSDPMDPDEGFGVVTRANEGVLDISNDPSRDAFFESTLCTTEGDLPWRVDPWAARLVPA